jgi:aminoglycoside phosphotransferase (APT) family kinase protein
MSFEDGTVVDAKNAATLPADVRLRLSQSVPTALASLHDIDLDLIGLGQLRRPGSYVQRQLKVWRRQLDGLGIPQDSMLHRVAASIDSDEPVVHDSVLLHGDFKLENLVCTGGGDVAAILDWELASVGDPLADLGWLLAWWAGPLDQGRWIAPPAPTAGGFTDRDAVATAYAAHSGRDLAALPYYTAFAYWRLSCINTTTRARFLGGAMGEKALDVEALEEQIGWQLRRARALLTGNELDLV